MDHKPKVEAYIVDPAMELAVAIEDLKKQIWHIYGASPQSHGMTGAEIRRLGNRIKKHADTLARCLERGEE